MFQQALAIARNTYTEAIRQPVYVVIVLLGCLVLVLNNALSAYTLDDDNQMLMDMGLSTLLLAGLLLATFTATGALSAEIENRTALTVISKPVARPVFVLGKYLGVSGAILMALYVLTLVFLLSLRHKVMQSAADEWDYPVLVFSFLASSLSLFVSVLGNYLYRWVWASTFVSLLAATLSLAYLLVLMLGPQWGFQSITTEFNGKDSQLAQLMVVIFLVFEAVLILTAVAVACSTRLGQVMTLTISATLFLLGLVSESIFGAFLETFDAARYHAAMAMFLRGLVGMLYACIPNLQFLWQADSLINHNALTAGHVGLLSAYAALQVTASLSIAVVLFQAREMD